MKKKKTREQPAVPEEAHAPDTPHAAEGTEKKGSGQPTDILEELGGNEDTGELKVSKTYAKKYNERKDREELTRAKRILADEGDSSDESSASTEDEDAELLTETVNDKIFETLSKIKSRDPSIYDKNHSFFDDADFSEGKKEGTDKPTKPGVTYKDFLRDTLMKEGADAIAREEEEMEGKMKNSKGKTPKEEQAELKASLLAAAQSEDDGDDDFLSIKKKTAEELKKEKQELAIFKPKSDKHKKVDADSVMAMYWRADEELNDEERFLRDYLMNKGWLETTSMQISSKAGEDADAEDVDDDKDEEHLDEQDDFERDYNFRFEVEEGLQIQGHARKTENSVRERPEKRKRQRKALAERKESDKIRRTEELKRLKNLKKQEIKRRLEQIREATGNEETALGHINLDEDFDPETHDKQMNEMLGEDYDQGEETKSLDELIKAPDGFEDLDVSRAKAEAEQRVSQIVKKNKSQLNPDTNEDQEENDEGVQNDGEHAEEEAEEEADPEQWWLCDNCHKGIPGGKKRFDCLVCENYTLCINCFRIRRHPHKFARRRVPDNCMPPEDLKGQEVNRDGMQEVLDEYFQLDYEDIIGGDLPTRFKYRKVESNSYGFTPEDILKKPDQELNRKVSMKKLRTYRDEGDYHDTKWDKKVETFAAKQKFWQQQLKAKKGNKNKKGTSGSGSKGLSNDRLNAYNLQEDRGFTNKRKKPQAKSEGKK